MEPWLRNVDIGILTLTARNNKVGGSEARMEPWLRNVDIGILTLEARNNHVEGCSSVAHLRLGPWHLYEGTQKSLSLRCSSGIKAPILIWDWGRRTFTRVPKSLNSL